MVKLVALYRKPEDPAAFDARYFGEHMPLARQMPGLRRAEVARVTGSPGGESEYYMIAELYFDNMEAAQASMASEESRAAARVLKDIARGLVSMHVAEVVE